MTCPLDEEFKLVVEQFIAAEDRGDAAALASTYGPDFMNIRVEDGGGLAWLSAAQILAILQVSEGGNHSFPVRETIIHRAEIDGDLGYVLLTRTKDHGNGWEPTFYSLVWGLSWDERGGRWQLLREFVHQKNFPSLGVVPSLTVGAR